MPEMRSETTPGGPEIPSSSTNEQVIGKSDKVWFDDGNIILQTATKRYRVHKGVLATHSSVFKDMITLPQPVEETEVFEGCPIVHLTDSTEDWDEFLPLFYNMRELRTFFRSISVNLMVAMLRLGHKYGCERFKRQGLAQFLEEFPDDYDSYVTTMSGKPAGKLFLCDTAPRGYDFYLLDVALEMGIQTVSPAAFFTCLLNRTVVEIFNGSYDVGPARSGILRPQTRETLLQAKEKILQGISDEVYSWWRQPKTSSKCANKEICADIIRQEANGMIGVVPNINEIFPPITEKIKSIKGLCQKCKNLCIDSLDSSRRRVFDKLPSYFGLPEWDDLKDFET